MKTQNQRDIKKARKIQKVVNREAQKIVTDFQNSFRLNDYIRERPKFFPRWMWNLLINSILKK
jgi:hypothetical protein